MLKVKENVKQLKAVQAEFAMKYNNLIHMKTIYIIILFGCPSGLKGPRALLTSDNENKIKTFRTTF